MKKIKPKTILILFILFAIPNFYGFTCGGGTPTEPSPQPAALYLTLFVHSGYSVGTPLTVNLTWSGTLTTGNSASGEPSFKRSARYTDDADANGWLSIGNSLQI